MGLFLNWFRKKETNEGEKEDISLKYNYPLRTISYDLPINEPKPIIVSKGIYYNKIDILGKKRNRTETKNAKTNEQKIYKKNINTENNINNKSISLKEENSKEKENIEKEKEKKFLNISYEIITRKIKEEKMKIDEKNFKDNKAYIEKFFKDLKDENEKKYEKISEKYDEIFQRNNILFEQLKNHLNIEKLNIHVNKKYSYECLTNNLYVKGIQGIDQLSIQLNIKNNGDLDWPEDNIYLICDKEKSDILAEDVQLISLKSQMTYSIYAVFNFLNLIPPGKYNSYLNFNINGKNYGRELKLIVEIMNPSNMDPPPPRRI